MSERAEWRARRVGITLGALMGLLAPGRHYGYTVDGMPADAVCRQVLPDYPNSTTMVLVVESATFAPVPEGQLPPWLELALTAHYEEEG